MSEDSITVDYWWQYYDGWHSWCRTVCHDHDCHPDTITVSMWSSTRWHLDSNHLPNILIFFIPPHTFYTNIVISTRTHLMELAPPDTQNILFIYSVFNNDCVKSFYLQDTLKWCFKTQFWAQVHPRYGLFCVRYQ